MPPRLCKYQDEEGRWDGSRVSGRKGGNQGTPHNDVTVRDFVPCLRLRGDKEEEEEGERLTLDCAHFHLATAAATPIH